MPSSAFRSVAVLAFSIVFVSNGRWQSKLVAAPPDTAPPSSEEVGKRLDCFGDPLPPGAMLRLGTVRLRQGDSAEGVAFSPDGKFLASCGWDAAIHFWDSATGRMLRQMQTDEADGTLAVAFSPDGARLASVSDRGLVRLWDVATGKQISKVLAHVEREHGVRTYGVAFGPAGLPFATGGQDTTIRLWDATTGALLFGMETGSAGSDARPVAFSPDGTWLASGSRKGTIQMWNLATSEAKTIATADNRGVVSLAFLKDGDSLVSSGSRSERTGPNSARMISQIHVWSVATGEKQPGFEIDGKVQGECAIVMSNDRSLLASGHYEKLIVWDVQTRKLKRVIEGEARTHYGGRTHSLAVSPDNRLLAAITFGSGRSKIYLWNIETGEPLLPQIECHSQPVLALDVSPDGTAIVSGSADGTVRLWDAATGKHVRILDKGSGWVRYVQFFPDGEKIALARETYEREKIKFEGEAKICSVSDAQAFHRFSLPDRAMCGALSPDGSKLAVGLGLGQGPLGNSDGPPECQIVTWNTHSGERIAEFDVQPHRVQQLKFAANGSDLYSVGEDQALRKWSLGSGEEIETHGFGLGGQSHFTASLISPNGAKTAVRGLESLEPGVSRGRMALIEGSKAIWEKTFTDSWPFEFAMSADGQLLAAYLHPLSETRGQRRIVVFAAADGNEVVSFPVQEGRVRSLAFSRDGRRLLSGTNSSDALVWDVYGARDSRATQNRITPSASHD
jgi:WD40 repeat protein